MIFTVNMTSGAFGSCSGYMVKTVGAFGGAYRNPPPTNVRVYIYVNPVCSGKPIGAPPQTTA